MSSILLLAAFLAVPMTLSAASDVSITRHRDLLLITAPATRNPLPAAILSIPLTVDFAQTPVADVADLIARTMGVNTVVDPTLRAAGTTVTLKVEHMAAGNVLNWIQQTSQISVTWVDSALYFSATPPRQAQVTRAYDVADLVLRVSDFPGPELSIPDGSGGSRIIPGPDRPDTTPTTDELIELIEKVIATKDRS